MKTFHISTDELLQLWKLHHGYAPMRNDCTISRSDGLDFNALALEKIRAWYTRALSDMPASLLPLTDISAQLEFGASRQLPNCARLPEGCVRIAAVSSSEWTLPALIVTDLSSPEALAQTNPFARAGAERPVAIKGTDTLSLFPAPAEQASLQVMAVMMPDQNAESYPFTAALLADMPFAE